MPSRRKINKQTSQRDSREAVVSFTWSWISLVLLPTPLSQGCCCLCQKLLTTFKGPRNHLYPGHMRQRLCPLTAGSVWLPFQRHPLPLCSPQRPMLPVVPHPAVKSILHGSPPPAPWIEPQASAQATTEGSCGHQQSTSHLSEPSPHIRGFCYQLFSREAGRPQHCAEQLWSSLDAVVQHQLSTPPLSCCFSPWAEENTQ